MQNFYDYINKTIISRPTTITKEEYQPVITNDKIGLLSNSFDTNIATSAFLSFDVVKCDTLELVGEIGFQATEYDEFFYGGNVDYRIYNSFQHLGYGTQSLSLLKELLQQNTYAMKEGILISTLPDNIYSQRIAIKNGGILIYEGLVPRDTSLYKIDHVEEVKVYQIQMKK